MYKLELAKAQAEYELLLGEIEKNRLGERSRINYGKGTIQQLIGRLAAKMAQETARSERNTPV